MSFPILTTTQYDATKYTPAGSVVLNRVEGISLLRNMFAGIGALFGGKNTLIQEAVDRLQARSLTDFTAKVQATYPNTVQVIALHTDISEVGRDDNATFMTMTMSGTCLVPFQSGIQTGGVRRNNDPEVPSGFANSTAANNPTNVNSNNSTRSNKKNNNTKRNNGRLTMNNLSTNERKNNRPLTMNNLDGGRRVRKSKTRRN
jgi:uncharacterized protein YbjQ (UPF0145 family)